MRHALLAGVVGLSLLSGCAREETPKRNVVLIVIDTLRADRTSLGGGERETTPAIDAWAKRGTVFERANSTSSWTQPSMGTLLTGRYRYGSGKTLTDTQRLLSQVLQGAGYRTIGIVANPVLNPLGGFDAGYERYDLTDTKPRGWLADVVVDKALHWLREERDERPFLLYLHLMDPHSPYAPDKVDVFDWRGVQSLERRAVYESNLAPQHAGAISAQQYDTCERLLAMYDSEILQADQELARLFEYLDQSGLSEDTLVILTSDHGEGLWDHSSRDGWVNEGSFIKSHVPELYRGHGEQLYGELLHVPLAIVGPSVPAGAHEERPVSLVDVVPTILSLLDIASPTELHGAPLFDDVDPNGHTELFAHIARGTSVTVDGRWKLLLPSERVAKRGGVTALYDLKVDPNEDDPVDDSHKTRELTAKILSWRERYSEVGKEMSLDEQRALLIQMGYVGLAKELDEETTQEEIKELMKPGKERRAARQPGAQNKRSEEAEGDAEDSDEEEERGGGE